MKKFLLLGICFFLLFWWMKIIFDLARQLGYLQRQSELLEELIHDRHEKKLNEL